MNPNTSQFELGRAWTTLTRPEGDELVRSVVVAQTTDQRPIRICVDRAGNRTLTVATTEDDQPELTSVDGALRTAVRELRFTSTGGEHLSIECTTSELFDVFTELSSELVETLSNSERPACAAVEQLGRWRELLRTRSLPNLSLQQELGLFGELWVLSALVESASVNADMWTGPHHDSHDFDFGTKWAEVKTVGSGRTTFTVHGLEQLDTSDGRSGHLVVLEVSESVEGVTIAEIVDALELALGPDALVEKLALCRWNRNHPDRRWLVDACLVADATEIPRLIPASLSSGVPAGISNVTYEVDVDSVATYATHGRANVTAIGEPHG